MSDPSPTDAKQMKIGDTVALFVGEFDPPTMDHYRVIEALLAWTGVSHVWVCPMSGASDDHVRATTSMLCMDFASGGRQISHCTIALDKKMTVAKDALDWVRTHFPYLKFQLASLYPNVPIEAEQFFQIAFGSGAQTSNGATGIVLDKFLPAPADVKARIAAGEDQSRNIITPVWNYIQKNRLYR